MDFTLQSLLEQVVLSALAPRLIANHRGADGRFDGLSLAFARRLGVNGGRRTRTDEEKVAGVLGRPRAFLQAVMTRAAVDEAALKREGGGSFIVGASVLAGVTGQLGTLVGIHDEGGCTVEFKAGAAYEQVHACPRVPQRRGL